jgi:eukaryotic-like serine/threonine-protein kinase
VGANDGRRVGGRYELVSRIARGGGGTVWRAHDTALDRPVAVKAVDIPDELTSEDRSRARRRVLQEARAAARLDHPAAVVVHDVLDDEDRLHLVMELVQAPTLRQLVDRDGPLSEEVAARIGLGLTDVLSAAHDRGIVHRDVKPSNVFVLDDGSVKLADFGIAAMAGEASLTRTGTALGSPSYLAPEQAKGEDASAAADVWGLGATLYHAVEGEPPFDRGSPIATVNAVVHEPIRPPVRAERLRPLLGSLLAKEPLDRPTLPQVGQELRTLVPAPNAGRDVHPLAAETSAPTEPVVPALAEHAPAADETHEPEAHSEPEAPHEPEAPAERTDQQRRRRALAVLAGFGALVLLGVGALTVLDQPSEPTVAAPAPDDEDTGTTDGDPAEDDAPEEEPPEDADVPATPPEDGTQAGDDADDGDDPAADDATDADPGRLEIPESDVPDGWQVVEGETYRVAVPATWRERDGAGNLTDYVDPASGAYLRVDWTDDPAADPVADWEANEAGFAERQTDYQRIRLEPATYRGEDAALWEYTYRSGGAALHAVNLNLLSGDRAYALNLQAPAGDWEEVGGLFPAIAGGFEPAG